MADADTVGKALLDANLIAGEDSEYGLYVKTVNGITYFDTARFYTDSEEKIGYALSDIRDKVVIATKTGATTAEGFWKDLETSLSLLKTDFIDLYQFHNPAFCPKPNDGTGLYEAMLEAKRQGKVLHIGITNHRLEVARESIASGLYETLQFPFSYLASDKDLEIVQQCKDGAWASSA